MNRKPSKLEKNQMLLLKTLVKSFYSSYVIHEVAATLESRISTAIEYPIKKNISRY